MIDYLLINDQLAPCKAEFNTAGKEHFTRLVEQYRMYEGDYGFLVDVDLRASMAAL